MLTICEHPYEVGCTAVAEDGSLSYSLNITASIFTSEFCAILMAVHQTRRSAAQTVTIVTDSRSSIQAIRKLYPINTIINRIHAKMLKSGKQYGLCWVPSHIGIAKNDQADCLARSAVSADAPSSNQNLMRKRSLRKKCNSVGGKSGNP